MHRFLLVFILMSWISRSTAQTTAACIDEPNLSLRKDWKYLDGFDSAWLIGQIPIAQAKPITPGNQLEELSEIRPGQLYTLFLVLPVRDSCTVNQYLCIKQAVASRVYLDGALVARFGELSQQPGGTRAFDPMNRPVLLPPLSAGNHQLMVVLALQESLRPRSMFGRLFPLFDGKILPHHQAMDLFANRRFNGMEYMNWGIFMLLFLVHFFSYLVNPASKLQGWFCLFALASIIMGIPGVATHDPIWVDLKIRSQVFVTFLRILSYIFLYISYLEILKPVSWRWGIPIIVSMILASLNDWFTPSAYRQPLNLILECIGPAMMAILAYRKKREGNPSARYLFWGTMLYFFSWFAFLFLLPFEAPGIVYDVIFKLSLLSIPLSISMVLSQQFRYTNLALEKETIEKERLAREKEQLLRDENQKLEAEVARRTSELRTKNRELEIGSALERVRSRTMAMHTSSELHATAELLFDQVRQLGAELQGVAFAICDKDSVMIQKWTSIGVFSHPYTIEPVEERMYEAWKNQTELYEEVIEGERQRKYYEAFMEIPAFRQGLQKFIDSGYPMPTWQKNHAVSFRYGYLLFITTKPFAETQIFLRFGKVFDQTYTRFLDLQRAETQAREAQIEAALERVRSRSLAMHHSSELSAVVDTLLREFTNLEFTLTFCIINLINEQDRSNTVWAANPETGKPPESYYMKFEDYPFHHAMWDAWKAQKKNFIYTIEGEEKKIYDEYLYTKTEFRRFPKHVQEANKSLKRYVAGFTFFKYSGLQTVSENHISNEDLNILERFGRVFEQSYTRFLDLQKAEAQTREAEIQLALERVRARSLAMHHTSELQEVVNITAQQLHGIGMDINGGVFICINAEVDTELSLWASGGMADYVQKVVAPLLDKPIFTRIRDAIKKGDSFLIEKFSNEEKLEMFSHLFQYEPWKSLSKERREALMSRKGGFARSVVISHYTSISITNHHGKSYTEEENEILKRFGKVFEQSYIRFLDLQKAEAQTREAQIEAALERVRSRGMGMQKSEELKEVIQVVYDQMVQLNLPVEHTGFIMDYKHRNDYDNWIADHLGSPANIVIPYFDALYYNRFNEAKREGAHFFALNLSFGEKNRFYHDLFKHLPGYPEDSKKYILEQPALTISTVLLDDVALYIENFSGTPYSEEENGVLLRFGKVFQQTYTRFLDLQKAEAQAREAQIEAALERVRSRTMGMQKSTELNEVAFVLFEQVRLLGGRLWGTGFALCNAQEGFDEFWFANEMGVMPSVSIPNTEDDVHKAMLDGWKQNQEYLLAEKGGDALAAHYAYLFSLPQMKEFFGPMLAAGFRFPTWQQWHAAYFSKGYLLIITTEPYSEPDIFKRFAKVFDQTYTRFLDLQKAEAQAREAQNEAALERVRARAMAMQRSQELGEVVHELRKQMGLLGQKDLETCVIHLHDESPDYIQSWAGIKTPESVGGILAASANVPKRGLMIIEEALTAYHAKRQDYVLVNEGGKLRQWFSFLETASPESYTKLAESVEWDIEKLRAYWSFADFEGGSLVMVTRDKPHEYSRNLLRRFSNVFGLAYRRFTDIKQAEAQAREAQIEAALEKVRGRTMAMQSSDELADAAYVLFEQMNLLGVTHERINIGIVNENNQTIDFWVTEQGGDKLNTRFSGRISEPTTLSKAYEAWKKGEKSLTIDLQGESLASWLKFMDEEIHIPFNRAFLHNRRVHTVGFFSKGMLVVTSPEPLREEALYLLEKFAGVFDLTYTRFSDLKVAEAHALQAEKDLVEIKIARQKAEEALNKLKATQAQLIQQEKLASLGQLTAGIAHEIQNPLNFVNNFSEINAELSAEILEAAAKGDLGEVKALATDIRSNQEKIREHGRRADAIVKGMLQHSRSSTGAKEPTDLAALADEYLRLAYHGMRAKDKSFNASIKTSFEPNLPLVPVVAQDIGRVLLNLFNNAFYAVHERMKAGEDGYEPELELQVGWAGEKEGAINHGPSAAQRQTASAVQIRVRDNGPGIPEAIKDKIFQPFFTTKPSGQGTGLGLSLSYDIITKGHGGNLELDAGNNGTAFRITLPLGSS
jgi:signal transduction histidine kinase